MARTAKKKPLGRGLSALISSPAVPVEKKARTRKAPQKQTTEDGVSYLTIGKIKPNAEQPRKEFKTEELQELSDSIKSLGLIQPILVRKMAEKDDYQIVAGERRWRAAKLAGLRQVPVIIRDLKDREALEIALVENIQRQNLNPLEEARAYQALIDDFSISQQELANRVGKKRSSISNYIRILNLPEEVLNLLSKDKISMGHAKAIMSVKEPRAQINLAQKILKENLSVREIENIVGRVVPVSSRSKSKAKVNAMVAFSDLENKLKNKLGTKVRINTGKKGAGKISIDYYSEEELERLVDILLN